eukprot:CAMPEP_0118927076 /NCGR_PEP_ID=MMETSP1169-20130426/4637_1 /TAXON_ID=36882 /ORGANISM="Pyramimonas obovata, Strain CCMP722" /LENGTH=248 /DNA_ID=CAMNT_0006868769 /DNA_START=42 /DNA_END=785 /DNA_ORIENTATION=+
MSSGGIGSSPGGFAQHAREGLTGMSEGAVQVRPTYLYVTASTSPKRFQRRPLAVVRSKRWQRKLGTLHVRRVQFAESNGTNGEPGLPELVKESTEPMEPTEDCASKKQKEAEFAEKVLRLRTDYLEFLANSNRVAETDEDGTAILNAAGGVSTAALEREMDARNQYIKELLQLYRGNEADSGKDETTLTAVTEAIVDVHEEEEAAPEEVEAEADVTEAAVEEDVVEEAEEVEAVAAEEEPVEEAEEVE